MGFLGGGDKHEADDDALRAEVERLGALPLKELAAEVMTKGFGPGGPAAGGAFARPSTVAGAFIQAESSRGLDQELLNTLLQVSDEGLQVLEHACLVRFQFGLDAGTNDNYNLNCGVTRLGAAALEQNTVAQILAGTA